MTGCIYKITCIPNGKFYVGSTIHFTRRVKNHLGYLQLGRHKNSHLQNAFNKYGKDAFVFEIIEIVVDKALLLEREKYWMDFTNCYDRNIGFNICIVPASSLGIKRTQEFKEKVRQANLNRSEELKQKVKDAVKNANIGRVSWNKGFKMWSVYRHPGKTKGMKFPNRKPFSEEWYRNVCAANRKPKTPEYSRLRSNISSKAYYFIDPATGCELKIRNLSEFCDKYGLNKTRMYQVAKGNEPHHRGWIRDEDCYIEPDNKAA